MLIFVFLYIYTPIFILLFACTDRPFMETIVVLGVTAVVASAVAYSLIGVTWQEYSSTTLWKLSAQWEYNQWNLWDGCVVGIFAGFFTGVFILMLGITRQLFSRLRQRLSWSPFLLNVVPCVLGGVCIGTLSLIIYLYLIDICVLISLTFYYRSY